MRNNVRITSVALGLITLSMLSSVLSGADSIPTPGSKLPAASGNKIITQADVTAEKVGDSIPASAIGEPVSAVKRSAPQWVAGADANSSYATGDGWILPVEPNGKPINF